MSLLARVGAFLRHPLRRNHIVRVTNLNGETRMGHVRGWGPPLGRIYCDLNITEPVLVRGDAVPHFHSQSSYSIETKEGWWVNVAQGRIQDWSVRPTIGACVFYTGKLGGALRGYGRVR